MMKFFIWTKFVVSILFAIIIFITLVSVIVNVINADLFARLIETKEQENTNFGASKSDENPTLTLIMHRLLQEENAIECSIVLSYYKQNILSQEKENTNFLLIARDGSEYSPFGLYKKFSFPDTSGLYSVESGFETNKFCIPTTTSTFGFPFDNIKIHPIIELYKDGKRLDYNYKIQKRMLGRIFEEDKTKYKRTNEIIELTRSDIEKYFVIICSLIFISLAAILTYGIVTRKKGLSSVDEIIIVAGYIIAAAGFRDMLGFNKIYGISALEVIVILIPLLIIFIALVCSICRGLKSKQN